MKDLLIKVGEPAHPGLLDRDGVISDIKEHLKPWCKLIEDVTNYGSNLIPRCFISSERQLKDAVVLAILLRQVVAMLDGVDILLSNGACHVSQLPARALFEASVYIDWILQGEAERKSLYYYVHNLRRLRVWAKRTQSGSPEAEAFLAATKKYGFKLADEVQASSGKQLEQIEKVLSQPKFAEISADFDRLRKGKKYDLAWYVPLGPKSLSALAKAVDKVAQYLVLYSPASDVMHGSSYERHVLIGKGDITFQPIRSLEGFETVLRFSVGDAFGTYRKILQEYRPGELPVFGRTYLEKWQQTFLHFPPIKYEVKSIRI